VKAIIVAAGRGRRLGPETAAMPKCMVSVGGRPILHRQLAALTAAGADEIVIVRGYLGERILPPAARGGRGDATAPVRFVENPEWDTNNILASLMYAECEMPGGFLFSYSDIVFATAHARAVAASTADVALIVDRRWQDAYVGRIHHPVPEAELVAVEDTAEGSRVRRVGKRVVPAAQAAGEFSGLARFSAAGAAALAGEWARAKVRGMDQPYGQAASLRQAYLSDALNQMADDGVALVPIFVDGGWREIDTEEDLGRAHALVDGWDG
jgi:L-glutamine-phosphate cytidylyltransferase